MRRVRTSKKLTALAAYRAGKLSLPPGHHIRLDAEFFTLRRDDDVEVGETLFPESTVGTLGHYTALTNRTETTEGKEQPISRRCRLPYLMSRRRKVRRHRVRCRLKG
jgi:hypothetical protein